MGPVIYFVSLHRKNLEVPLRPRLWSQSRPRPVARLMPILDANVTSKPRHHRVRSPRGSARAPFGRGLMPLGRGASGGGCRALRARANLHVGAQGQVMARKDNGC